MSSQDESTNSQLVQYPCLAPPHFSDIEDSNIKRSVISGPAVVRLVGREPRKPALKVILCFLKPLLMFLCLCKAAVYNNIDKDGHCRFPVAAAADCTW